MTDVYLKSIEELQDLFYRCKFSNVIASIQQIEDRTGNLSAELLLIKANSQFELHNVEEAKATLKEVRASSDGLDEGYLYAVARVSHLDGNAAAAREFVQQILENTEDPHHKFKALLGIANTYYSEGEFAKIPPLIERLCSFEPLGKVDLRISLMIFLGNYYFASGSSSELARNYFKKALATSAAHTWTYFITRSLFGQAAICEKEGQHAELMWTLETLQSFVDESEQLLFTHIVNSRFKAYFSINTPVEFDSENQRIFIKDKWVAFHDKPMLFKFLMLLHQKQSFVEKNEIASDLWPQEGYKSRVHDPRIFDIAKRARNMIEAYENQPVVLLSGRMGYKLATM